MKRMLALFVCIVLLGSAVALPVSAASEDQIVISQTVENLGNGCFYVETISVPSIQPFSNSKVGSKTAMYIVSEQPIYSVTVTGTFTYDGTTATATSAEHSEAAYVSGVTLVDSFAYTFGAYACASATVEYQGVTLAKTVKLLCSRDGTLS